MAVGGGLPVCLSVCGWAGMHEEEAYVLALHVFCSVSSIAPFLSFKGGIEEGRGGEKKINETFLLFILYRPSPFL